ncbi:MAG: argininosuccinate lyase [Flexilinea sp.]
MKENTLWSGGRLDSILDQYMAKLNQSLDVDQRMAQEDIRGSIAWAGAIFETGIITKDEFEMICSGLHQISKEFSNEIFHYSPSDEDIHTAVERRLTELIGPTGGKLHTGRSRNDQVVTDFRLWIKKTVEILTGEITELQSAFIYRARTDLDVIVSGYTHFQQAQPILLSHWWLSHFWALERDKQRIQEMGRRADILPLGCGALAGTAYPIDRFRLAADLEFSAPAPNSIDAVSDRDFACDFLYWASMLGVHLSRCAEAMILYSTMEFGYISLSDNFSTGSSLMPQKKNPDSLELIRGKSGGLTGRLCTMLTTLKGLPSAYDKDLQDDKKLVFESADTASLVMAVMNGVLRTLTVNRDRCKNMINMQALATDIADYLVKKGMPFREAHHAVGKAVKLSETTGTDLAKIPLEKWQEISPLFDDAVYAIFSLEASISQRSSWGGTSRNQVMKQLAYAEKMIQ